MAWYIVGTSARSGPAAPGPEARRRRVRPSGRSMWTVERQRAARSTRFKDACSGHTGRPRRFLDALRARQRSGIGRDSRIPSRRRTTWRAMVSAASSWRSTKLVLAARMSPLSSNVSASGSSSDGSSPRSMAATTSWRTSAGEPALEGGDALLDRPRPGAHLEGGTGEEAAARERPPQEVVEVGVAQGDELGQPRWRGEGRFDDLGVEDPLGLLHRGQLEVLLGVEVGVDPALAHLEGGGEVADRQTLQTVDGGQ